MNLPYNRDALRGRVAVVAGATRGAGRGIAAALGEAGNEGIGRTHHGKVRGAYRGAQCAGSESKQTADQQAAHAGS